MTTIDLMSKLHSRLRFFKSWAGEVAFRMTLSWFQTYLINSWFLIVAAVLQACFSPKTQQSHFLTTSMILQAHTAVINMVIIIINRRVVLFVFLPQIQKQWKGACLVSEGGLQIYGSFNLKVSHLEEIMTKWILKWNINRNWGHSPRKDITRMRDVITENIVQNVYFMIVELGKTRCLVLDFTQEMLWNVNIDRSLGQTDLIN